MHAKNTWKEQELKQGLELRGFWFLKKTVYHITVFLRHAMLTGKIHAKSSGSIPKPSSTILKACNEFEKRIE